MTLYCYADQFIESQIPLAELSIAPPGSPTDRNFNFRRLTAPPPELKNIKWVNQCGPKSSQPYQYIAYSDNKFFLRYTDHADFVISKSGRQLEVWPHPDATNETLRHLLLDQVLPRVLDHQGQLVIHAGSTLVGNSAIAFVGDTGAGKSTLTANFHINGYPLLSDDGLLINPSATGTMALATYPSLRLWPDTISSLYTQNPHVAPVTHYSDKLRVVMEESDRPMIAPLHLAAIYLLAAPVRPNQETISDTLLGPSEACISIIANSFQLDAGDKNRAAERLKRAAIVSRSVPVFRLEYERHFSTLQDIRSIILKQTKGLTG